MMILAFKSTFNRKLKQTTQLKLIIVAIVFSQLSINVCGQCATCSCSTETILMTVVTPPIDKYFAVGGPWSTATQTISQFSQNSNLCTQSNIAYQMTVTSAPLGIDPNFIKFTSNSLLVEFSTGSTNHIGTYTITITGTITAALTFTKTTSFNLVVLGCADSIETIIITPSATPAAQSYSVGTVSASTVITSFTENSAPCSPSDIVYSMTVTPSTYPQFITFIQASRTVQWQTNDISKAGSYTIQIAGTINANQSWMSSLSFVLNVVSIQCDTTTENTLVITPSTAPSAQTYSVRDPLFTVTINQFTISNAVLCQESDIVYSMAVSPTTQTFISFNETNINLSWYTSTNTDSLLNYRITVIGTIKTLSAIYSSNLQFDLTVLPSCMGSTDSFSLIPSSVVNKSYIITNPTGSYTVAAFTGSGQYCSAANIVYTMSVTPQITGQDTSFITLNSSTITSSWQTSSPSDVGSFQITITGKITTYSPSDHTASVTCILTVTLSCDYSTEENQIVASASPTDKIYTVGATGSSITITKFTVTSNYCSEADIVYSMSVTPSVSGSLTTFITFDSSSQVVSWSTAQMSHVGTYTVQIIGQISTTSVWSQSVQFVLTVIVTCATSTEFNQILESLAPADKTYNVGANASSQTIAQFSVTSTVCNQADIVYKMRVTPVTTGMSTSFITFDNTIRTVTWSTNSNTQVGTYYIYVDGQINTSTLWSKTVSFTLTVTGSCAYSAETIQITPGTAITDQMYFLGDPLFSLAVTQFTLSSTYCTQSDIFYSIIVTPLTSGMSTSFITFNSSTIIVAWFTNSFDQVEQYTITVSAQISALSIFSSSTTFKLTVPPSACPYTNENFIITPSSITPNQTYFIGSNRGYVTIEPFTSNSTKCTSNDIVYSIDVTPSIGLSFIQFNSTTLKVTWQTKDILLAGVYSAVVTGIVTSSQIVQNSAGFSIVAWIFTEPKISDQEYLANSQLLQIRIDLFSVMPSSYQNTFCINKPVAYIASSSLTAPIDQTQLQALPSWIQFQQSYDGSGVFSVSTNFKDLKDSYIIAILLQFSDSEQTFGFSQFNLKIKYLGNQTPVFKTKIQSSYNATCNSVFQLPEFSDSVMTPLTLTYFFGSANFMKGDNHGAIKIEKDCPSGTYQVIVSLTNQDGQKQQFKFSLVFYQLNGKNSTVQKPQSNQAHSDYKIVGSPITIQSVSNTGLATFKFGATIIVPNITSPQKPLKNRMLLQLKDYITPKVLQLKMSKREGTEVTLTNWTAVSITEVFLQIQIFFSSPTDVSLYETDFLKATFLNAEIFVLSNGNGFLFNEPSDLMTNAAKIPTQFLSQDDAEAAQKQIQTVQSLSYTTITITLIIQLLAKKLISFIWLFFCAIQVIIFLNQNVNYNLTATAYITITALHDIISLNAFNKDEALEIIGLKEVTNSLFFNNLGGIAFLMVIVIIAIILVGIMIKFCKRPFFQPIVNKIKAMLLWNFTIRYFYAAFLNLFFSSIVSLKSDNTTVADIVVSSLILTLLICVVIGFTRLLVQLQKNFLEMPNVKRSFGMLYTNLRTQKLSTRLYNQTFFVQRMALALIVAFKLDFGIQAGLLQFAILMHTIYLLGVRPYQTMDDALPDILNEIFLILAVVVLICLSPWQTDNMLRYQTGHALTALIGLFFALNFGIIFFRLGTDTYKKACLKMYKKKVKKQHDQLIRERRAEIERRLRKIAKRSGLVQFTELDNVNDLRPHINQILFGRVINTKQMFSQINNFCQERALAKQSSENVQPLKKVEVKKSISKEIQNRNRSTQNYQKSKSQVLKQKFTGEKKLDNKPVSKDLIQKFKPQQIILSNNFRQKLQIPQKVQASTKSSIFRDTENEKRWNLIMNPPLEQNSLINTSNQVTKTYFSQYLDFMDRQIELTQIQNLQISREDRNEQNFDQHKDWNRNQYSQSEHKIFEQSPIKQYHLPKEFQLQIGTNFVVNQPLRELKDRQETKTQQLQKKPFESQLVFTEAKVKQKQYTSIDTKYRNNFNDKQLTKPIWLQS